jgi:hypothetical protein
MEVKMRRKDLILTEVEAWDIIRQGEIGFLATMDADGHPYGVVLNHAVEGRSIYFHSAAVGHKLDNISAHPQVSYVVVSEHQVLPAKMSAYYRSAMAFGTAKILTEDEPKRHALRLIMEKYSPGYVCRALEDPAPDMRTCVVEICVDRVTGKRSADSAE